MLNLEKINNAVEKQRMLVPKCNLKNYDISAEAYKREMCNRPFEYNKLAAEFWQVIRNYKRNLKLRFIPPRLPRFEDETSEQYLERAYKAGGYFTIGSLKKCK